jgi:hypothetical protein
MGQAMSAFMGRSRLGRGRSAGNVAGRWRGRGVLPPLAHPGGSSPRPSPAHRTGNGAKDFAQAENIRRQNALPGDPQPPIVTRPGSWLWAGVYRGESLPGLLGAEYDWPDPSHPIPQPIEVFADSPVYCSGQLQYSDVTHYAARSGAGVFDAGTGAWLCALPHGLCGSSPRPGPGVRRPIEEATANLLQAFARGPAGRQQEVPGSHARA